MRLSILSCAGPFFWFTDLWNFRVNFSLKPWKSVYPWLFCLNSCLLLIRCYSENFVKTLHSDVTIGRKRWAYIFLILIVALTDILKKARFLCVWLFFKGEFFLLLFLSHGCVFFLLMIFFCAFPSDRFNSKTCCSNQPWSSIRFMTLSWITTPFCCFMGCLWILQTRYTATFPYLFVAKILCIPEFGIFL